jgi:outer membrane protein
MKKTLLLSIAFLGLAFASQAQRYAVIDTKYILNKIPEYKDADTKLQQIGEQWQKEIDDKQAQLDKMYKNYEAEQFMLTDELKKKREDELFTARKRGPRPAEKPFWLRGRPVQRKRQKLVKTRAG